METRDKCTVVGGKKYEKSLSIYARAIDRPGLEGKKVWKFSELKEFLLEKKIETKLIDKKDYGIMDISEAPEDKPFEQQRETTSLGGFAFSGNSFIRILLEKITGVHTGSDWDTEASLFESMKLQNDFPGEGLVDKRFLAVQHHGPSFEGNL